MTANTPETGATGTGPGPGPAPGPAASDDVWAVTFAKQNAETDQRVDEALNGPHGHVASEWHSGRFRLETRGADFTAAGTASTSLPRCAAYCSRDVSFAPATGVVTLVPLDRDQYDPDGWHDAATSDPYVILPTTGDYLVLAEFRPDSATTVPDVPLQLFLYGGATGGTLIDRDEDTHHSDDEHSGPWGSDSWRTLRIIYADRFTAGTKLNIRFRHFTGDASFVTFSYENELGPRLVVTQIG